MSCKIRFNFKV